MARSLSLLRIESRSNCGQRLAMADLFQHPSVTVTYDEPESGTDGVTPNASYGGYSVCPAFLSLERSNILQIRV